jgi:hypothetical protein
MQSTKQLDQFNGTPEAVETARLLAHTLPIMVTRVIISGPSVGTALLFGMIEADSGIGDHVRRFGVSDSTTVDEIKAFFAEARQVEEAVVCVSEVEPIKSGETVCALLAELDEPTNREISVFLLTRTPVDQLDIAWRRRFLLDIQLEYSSS